MTFQALPSAAVFSSQSKPPTRAYLKQIRSGLLDDPTYKPLVDELSELQKTCGDLFTANPDLPNSKRALQAASCLEDWIRGRDAGPIEQDMSGMITLPLLFTIQISQYLEYLKLRQVSHRDFLRNVKIGGLQGYCLGLLSAITIAASETEDDVAQYAAEGIKLAFALGAFGDAEENSAVTESNTFQVRISDDRTYKEIERLFPRSRISTVTSDRYISVITPPESSQDFMFWADREGLRPTAMHIRSNLHNADNEALAQACGKFVETLRFPSPGQLQVPVRSNKTGELLNSSTADLGRDFAHSILASKCDWSLVMRNTTTDLVESGRRQHNIAIFGIGDPVSVTAMQQQGLLVTKLDILTILDSPSSSRTKTKTEHNFPPNSIAIVGAACRLPGASSLDELWNIVANGETKFEPLRTDRLNIKESYRASQDPEWISQREFYGNFIDSVDCFDHAYFGISPREAKYMDPQQRLLLETAYEAMDSSGYLRHHERSHGDQVGCFLGACYTEYLENTSAYSPSAFTATSTIRAFLSGKISYHFGWTGPSEVIDTACSASLVAVHRACQAINTGECPVALAGGVNIITGMNNYFDLAKANFLSQSGQCKPFDESADGYCRADGVGLVVLKSLREAIADGDDIMGIIPAVGTNQGGVNSAGITVPDGTAQQTLYKSLLEKSGIKGEEVSYVEAHGPGTQVGDPIEIRSIREVFGGPERPEPLHIGSLKANIGHSETAAGVASLLKVLMMIKHRGLPPLANFKRLNDRIPPLELDKMAIPTKYLPWESKLRIACINSYGAAGSNSALLCAEWPERTDQSQSLRSSLPADFPVLLSAATTDSLGNYVTRLSSYLSKAQPGVNIANLAYMLSERRKHHRYRWTATATSLETLNKKLASYSQNDVIQTPKPAKKVILAFSGQSKTNIGLDHSTLDHYPQFERYLIQCNKILTDLGCQSIMPILTEQGSIDDPVMIQCGTVATQYASARCWIEGGLKVDGIVGHSLGELTALAVSGVLSLEDMLRVVYLRAQLVKTEWGPERGTMLAIHADKHTTQAVLDLVNAAATSPRELVEIACYNSVKSHVVVGDKDQIKLAIDIIQEDRRFAGVKFKPLDTSHGFHSRFTEPLLDTLLELGKEIKFHEPTIPIETSTLSPIAFGRQKTTQYFSNHARHPVYFVNAVERLERKLGGCVWLEAGLQTPISAMAKKAVRDASVHTFLPVVSPSKAFISLWKEGIDATCWIFLSPGDQGMKPVYVPPYCFDRHRHWLTHVDRAAEERRLALQRRASQGDKGSDVKPTLQLVTFDKSGGSSHHFHLNTSTERFKRIVHGHAVRHKPLCPASVYMESAIMGLEYLKKSARGKPITFESIAFTRPLGADEMANVRLCLEQDAQKQDTWKYNVQSGKNDSHTEGVVSTAASAEADFGIYEMLIKSQMTALRDDTSLDKLRKNTAYLLFSRVVAYDDLLRGILHITLGGKQALAEIRVPQTKFGASESSVTDFYDAVTIDTFIQVLGLLINSHVSSDGQDDIFVASSIGKMVMLPTDFKKDQTWTVFATYSEVSSKVASGAVFVFSEDGKLVSFATNIQFSKVRAEQLERVLEHANPQQAGSKNAGAPAAQNNSKTQSSTAEVTALKQEAKSAPGAASSGSPPAKSAPSSEDRLAKENELKSLISSYTGIAVDEMEPSQDLRSMGLDSLASIEFAEELESKLQIQVDTDIVLTGTVSSLLQLIPGGTEIDTSESVVSTASPPSEETASSASTSDTGMHTPQSLPGDLQSDDDTPVWSKPEKPLGSRFKIDTVPYKTVDDTDILADIYVPTEQPSTRMPVALMIHGGGHLTLSRRAVRPLQTKYLLTNGILPVSVDYRLCPQVNVLDGAMVDIRDACQWVHQSLPEIMASKDIIIDTTKFVVIGWSTGGTLAMTTSWTLPMAGIPSPAAVLSFYCPVEYDPEHPINMGQAQKGRTMSLREIRELLPKETTVHHAFNSLDTTKLGWVRAGDPRSELVLALVKEDRGMALLFNDNPLESDELDYPNGERAAAFSPLTRLRKGKYQTPTYLIFGDEDEIAPFSKGAEFGELLRERKLEGGFLPVRGAKHIFDLEIAPGSQEWEASIAPGYRFILEKLENAV